MFRTEECPEGRYVFHAGDFSGSFYIIVRGSVEMSETDELGVEKRTVVFQDGDCFGERALLDESQPEYENARALTSCVFLTLNRATYLQMIDESADLPG